MDASGVDSKGEKGGWGERRERKERLAGWIQQSSAPNLTFGETNREFKMYSATYLRLTIGVSIGVNSGLRAMEFIKDSNLRITGTIHHFAGCPSSRFLL